MFSVNETDYIKAIHDEDARQNSCKSNCNITNDLSDIILEIGTQIIDNKNIEYAGTYNLDRCLFLNSEFNGRPFNEDILGRNRVVSVNPGVSNIGREQKYIHCYIILAEYKNMFIGVPITNMAFDKYKNDYILRNPYEVELVNPCTDHRRKPYNEYWVIKRTVADIRNIAGLDKRRIILNSLYLSPKYAPSGYMSAIKKKMVELFSLDI